MGHGSVISLINEHTVVRWSVSEQVGRVRGSTGLLRLWSHERACAYRALTTLHVTAVTIKASGGRDKGMREVGRVGMVVATIPLPPNPHE